MGQAVLVTLPEYAKAENIFVSAAGFRCMPCEPSEEALAAAVRSHQACAVIIGIKQYAGPLYDALPRGGIIARFGVGHDGVDKSLATEKGLLVTNTPGALDTAVAEHAMTLMLSLARSLPRMDAGVRAGEWGASAGMELRGRRLAILGLGRIGKELCRMAALGFGMHVVAWGRTARRSLPQKLGAPDFEALRQTIGLAEYTTDLGEALRDADFVSVHLPATDETRHLICAKTLEQMKPGAYLINTARGTIVDELALAEALRAGRLAGAALDVFEQEPYEPRSPDSDLRKFPNVVLTPHVGSNTQEANARMAQAALANIRAALEKRYKDLDLVNPDVLNFLQGQPKS